MWSCASRSASSARASVLWLALTTFSVLCLSPLAVLAQQQGKCSIPVGLQPGSTMDVATEKQFYAALADPSVSIIRIVKDVQLAAETWSGEPLVVSRSILISGDTADYPSIDFSYLSKKCTLVANVTITFCRVMIRQTRYQLQSIAPGYDFFDKTEPPWARVVLVDCVSWYRACLPFNIAAAAAQNLKRPDLEPGAQNVSTDTVSQFCRLSSGVQQCWPNTGAQYNLAVEAQTTNSVGNYLSAGYALVTLESLYVCDVLMTTECIQTYGAGNCFTRTGSFPSPPPGPAGSGASPSTGGSGGQPGSANGAAPAGATSEQEGSANANERVAIIAGSAAGAGELRPAWRACVHLVRCSVGQAGGGGGRGGRCICVCGGGCTFGLPAYDSLSVYASWHGMGLLQGDNAWLRVRQRQCQEERVACWLQRPHARRASRTACISACMCAHGVCAGAIVVAAAVGFAIWKYNLLPNACGRAQNG